MKSGFLDKLLNRLDRLDPKSLQTQFLRLAQERGLLETIFQSIQEGVIVVDPDGAVTYANRAAEQLLGFSLEEARARPVGRLLREIDWDRVLHLDAGEWSRLMTREIEVTYPEHRFLNFYVAPLSVESKGETGAIVMLRDITGERTRAESVLESERFNAIKLLAAGVAHEIGNPLNALNIHLQLLERELRALPDESRGDMGELVEVARSEVSRLDMIITQFLRAIRPSKPDLRPCRIDELLTSTLNLLRLEIQNRQIDVQISVPKVVPEIRVDPDQIKQAFFNVIRNAYQAMPDGGALHIALETTDTDILLRFADTGVGISPEDFGRIFEPYHSTKEAGSGLGLMIVQRIVQDHGGQMEVESKPGEGTRFTILLPLSERRVRLLKAPPRERPAPAAPGETP